jgi:hypothetical protein
MTTDWGVESAMIDLPDILPAFAKSYLNVNIAAQEWLFPNAVWIPGFNHVWDGILRDVANALPFFPAFLSALKHVCSFMSNDTYRDCWQEFAVRVCGTVQASVLNRFKGKFAHWRWETLHTCCKALESVREVARDAWAVELFANVRNRVEISAVDVAFKSVHFWRHLQFVAELAEQTDGCRIWVIQRYLLPL